MRILSLNVITFIACLLSVSVAAYASTPSRHIVIAFDDALSTDSYREYLRNSKGEILRRISRQIERTDGAAPGADDYITAVGFVADTWDADLSEFAGILQGGAGPLSWRSGDELGSMFGSDWSTGSGTRMSRVRHTRCSPAPRNTR